MAKNNNNEVKITFKAFSADFNKSMKEMNAETSKLRQEMKLQQEQMKNTASSTDQLEAKINSLQQIYSLQRKKTQEAAKALEEAKKTWGENSQEVAKMEGQLKRQQIAEQQAANAVTETQKALERAQKAQETQRASMRELNNLLQVTGKSLGDFSDLLGQELTQAIQSGTATSAQLERAFKQISGATLSAGADINEVRQALAQLSNGANIDSVRNELVALSATTSTTEDRVKELQQAFKLQQEEMKLTATESQRLQANVTGLDGIYSELRQVTNETATALAQARAAYGENSIEAKKLESQLMRNRIAEQQMANSVKEAQSAQEQHANSLRQLDRLFDTTQTSINQFANVLGNDLVNAIREGRASASQLDDAFNRISRSALGANTDLEQIRQTLRTLDSGASVDQVRQQLEQLQQEAQQAQEDVKDLGGELQALGGVLAGAGIAGAIDKALEQDDLKAKIDVAFNVPESSKTSIRQALVEITKYGVDGEEALEGLRRQFALNKDASDKANSAIVAGAAAITYAYNGIDFTELIQETNEISKELKISDQEALDLVNSLLKIGFPPEQLDIIAEYGNQLRRAGYEAQEIKGIMAAAVNTGSWNIDSLLDGLKEGRIRATEMGRGLSESFKTSIRDVVDGTNKVSEEQIASMETNFAKQENALSKSLSNRYNALSKSYDQQKKALDKALDTQYDAAEDAYEDREEALEKSLEKEYDKQVASYEKSLEKLEKSMEDEVKAFEKASDQKIAIIDKEYTERLKLIDEEEYRRIKAIEDQIASINKTSEAEEKARKTAENNKKRAELQEKARTAKDAKSRQDAYQALRDFEEELRVEKIKEERQAQIDSLKDQKESIKESFDQQKDALKEETEQRKDKAKTAIEIEKEALIERQQEEKKSFVTSNQERLKVLKENQTAELSNFRETNAEKLNALRENHQQQQEMLSERLSAELSAVQENNQAQLESFREMNRQKLELTKNPPDSAEFKAIESQLMAWGDAIAQGGEKGSQAFEDMVRWLDTIEDGTLRNAIGTEIFGTMFEDQGDNIIDSVLNADQALKDFEGTEKSVAETAKEIGDTSGLVQFREAIGELIKALDPLFEIIANVVGKIAEWVSENPKFAAAIAAVAGAVGILIGAFTAIAPALFSVVTLFGGGSGGAGLLGIFSKVLPVISNLASKILPMLRVAFGALGGPIGLIVTALTLAVPLIIKHWDKIVAFFKGLGKILLDLVTGAFNGINNFIKFILEKLFGIVRGIIDKIKGQFSFTGMVDKVKGAFGKAYDAIVSPIQRARDAVSKIVDKIKGFFDFKFEWPEMKIPKLKIKKGSLNPVKWFTEGFPEIDIQWFAKGGIMNSPTVFGGSGNTAFAGGEAGPEAVIPLSDRVLGAIGDAIFRASNNNGNNQPAVINNYQGMLDGAVFHVREEADIKRIAREFYALQQRDKRGS